MPHCQKVVSVGLLNWHFSACHSGDPHEFTGSLPFKLIFGCQVRELLDMVREDQIAPQEPIKPQDHYLTELRKCLEHLANWAKFWLREAQLGQKGTHNWQFTPVGQGWTNLTNPAETWFERRISAAAQAAEQEFRDVWHGCWPVQLVKVLREKVDKMEIGDEREKNEFSTLGDFAESL